MSKATRNLLLFIVAAGLLLLLGQNPESSSWPPTAATDTELLVANNTAQDTLASGIDNSTLTIPLVDASEFTTPTAIKIGTEYIKICSKSTNTLTACSGGRGVYGSSAASHSTGNTVSGYYVAYMHNRLAAEVKALQTSATAKVANGTSALGTSAISSGACATVVTTSATGTATTDVIQWVFNADPTSTTGYAPSANGGLHIIAYPTSNNVNFKVCNDTASSITPGAVTLNWRVAR